MPGAHETGDQFISEDKLRRTVVTNVCGKGSIRDKHKRKACATNTQDVRDVYGLFPEAGACAGGARLSALGWI